jgi:hypothetical protein
MVELFPAAAEYLRDQHRLANPAEADAWCPPGESWAHAGVFEYATNATGPLTLAVVQTGAVSRCSVQRRGHDFDLNEIIVWWGYDFYLVVHWITRRSSGGSDALGS